MSWSVAPGLPLILPATLIFEIVLGNVKREGLVESLEYAQNLRATSILYRKRVDQAVFHNTNFWAEVFYVYFGYSAEPTRNPSDSMMVRYRIAKIMKLVQDAGYKALKILTKKLIGSFYNFADVPNFPDSRVSTCRYGLWTVSKIGDPVFCRLYLEYLVQSFLPDLNILATEPMISIEVSSGYETVVLNTELFSDRALYFGLRTKTGHVQYFVLDIDALVSFENAKFLNYQEQKNLWESLQALTEADKKRQVAKHASFTYTPYQLATLSEMRYSWPGSSWPFSVYFNNDVALAIIPTGRSVSAELKNQLWDYVEHDNQWQSFAKADTNFGFGVAVRPKNGTGKFVMTRTFFSFGDSYFRGSSRDFVLARIIELVSLEIHEREIVLTMALNATGSWEIKEMQIFFPEKIDPANFTNKKPLFKYPLGPTFIEIEIPRSGGLPLLETYQHRSLHKEHAARVMQDPVATRQKNETTYYYEKEEVIEYDNKLIFGATVLFSGNYGLILYNTDNNGGAHGSIRICQLPAKGNALGNLDFY